MTDTYTNSRDAHVFKYYIKGAKLNRTTLNPCQGRYPRIGFTGSGKLPPCSRVSIVRIFSLDSLYLLFPQNSQLPVVRLLGVPEHHPEPHLRSLHGRSIQQFERHVHDAKGVHGSVHDTLYGIQGFAVLVTCAVDVTSACRNEMYKRNSIELVSELSSLLLG